MAYALALKSYYDLSTGNGDVILTLTLIIAQATVIGVAALLHPLISVCDVKNLSPDATRTDVIDDSGLCTSLKKIILSIHENCLQPLFAKETLIPSTPLSAASHVARPESGASILCSEAKSQVQIKGIEMS